MKKHLLIAIFSIIFISSNSLYAQNETGFRSLNDTAFKSAGFWYDSTNSMFQNQYPIIRSIPPLSTGMPYDIMYSYIYLDSLLRFTTVYQQDSLIRSWSTLNDTLTNSLKFLYKIVDYNPIIFNQYSGEAALLNTSVSGGRYNSSLFDLRNKMASKLMSLVSQSNRKSLFTLLFSDYILKVLVVSIDSTLDKRRLPVIESSDSKRYKVYATILDTIKGKVFIDENPEQELTSKKSDILLTSQTPIIAFQYIKMCYSQHPYYPDNPYLNIENDTTFSDNNGGFKMSVGQEAIVFLTHGNQLFDFQYDYFDLDVESMYSNNALPIINGSVRDINLIWSQNTLQSYEAWRQAVNSLIQKILTRTF
jgi:hypothetical protein